MSTHTMLCAAAETYFLQEKVKVQRALHLGHFKMKSQFSHRVKSIEKELFLS